MRGFLDFAGCRRGSIPVMTALLLLPMIVITGGAIDFVAHERMRSKLQDGLDRGVLAAASLTQTVPTRETLESFLLTAIDGPYDLSFTEETRTNLRVVEADLEAEIDTAFLGLIGIDTLAARVHSKAEERRSNIEISLLLDVSGSMRWGSSSSFPGAGNMRIDALRPAANAFLDIVLEDEAQDYTSVNVVPYAGQVSVGPALFDALAGPGRRWHGKSSCFEFARTDYLFGVPNFGIMKQVQHFTHDNHHGNVRNADERKIVQPWWCPDDPHAEIPDDQPDWVMSEGDDPDVTSASFLSNDRSFLQGRIDNYKLYDGTGTPVAMKWGLMLLDPAIRPLLQTPEAAAALGIDPRFENRPAAFDDEGTLKFIVLMTDGVISSQRKPWITDPPPADNIQR